MAKGPHPARAVSTRSLVRQLARSAGHEISPRRRRCAVVFVGRREPINRAPGESRSIFWRRRSLSTKGRPNGKPPSLSSSVRVSPSHAQQGISGVRRQPPEAAMLRQTAIADCTFFETRRTTHFTAIALGRQRKLEARTKTARRDRPGQRHPSHGSLVRRPLRSTVLAQKVAVAHRGKIRFGS